MVNQNLKHSSSKLSLKSKLETDHYKDAKVIPSAQCTVEKSQAQHLSWIIIKMQPGDTTKRDEGALSGQKTTDYDT